MQKRAAFACHRVFIAARGVEELVRDGGQVGLDGHESVIAIDHHPRPVGTGEVGKFAQRGERRPGAEHHLADEDQIVVAGTRGGEKAGGEIFAVVLPHPLTALTLSLSKGVGT